jgi:hypothetical protein
MAARSGDSGREPPYEGGSQPVPEHRPEVPHAGRSVIQTVVIIIAVIAILAALLWIFVPFSA